jgi:hypothetical protein
MSNIKENSLIYGNCIQLELPSNLTDVDLTDIITEKVSSYLTKNVVYFYYQINDIVNYIKENELYKRTIILEILEDKINIITQMNLIFEDDDLSEGENKVSPSTPSNSPDKRITIDDILGDVSTSSSSDEVDEVNDQDEQDEQDEDLEYPDIYYLPILFSIDKSGSERMWKIWVEDKTVHRIQGLVKGKKQPYQRVYKAKNIGKKNETSPEEQAKQSAEKTWVDQISKGYFPKCNEGKAMLKRVQKASSTTGGHNINAGAAIRGRKGKTVSSKNVSFAVGGIHTFIKPMKAGVWELSDTNNPKSVIPKVLKYFNFEEGGVYIQPKLDGWRCIARVQNTPDGIKCILTTNNGKQYKWFGKLRDEIINFVKGREKLMLDGLDGELYIHRLVDKNGVGLDDAARFSTICKMCALARKEPHEMEDQMTLVVFDLVDLTGKLTQDDRFSNLKELFSDQYSKQNSSNSGKNTHVQLCETRVANFLEEVIDYHDDVAQRGYEGVIIRSRDLVYTDKRSLKMRKYKNFIDREYTIVDVEKDEGVADEYFVWVCQDSEIIDHNTGRLKRFKAKPKGVREDREYWYQNYLEYLGKPMTVKFQEYTEDGIPRFPIAIGIREDQ